MCILKQSVNFSTPQRKSVILLKDCNKSETDRDIDLISEKRYNVHVTNQKNPEGGEKWEIIMVRRNPG